MTETLSRKGLFGTLVINDFQHKWHSAYSVSSAIIECCILSNVMLNAVMPSVVLLNVVMLNVILLNVVMLNVIMMSVIGPFIESSCDSIPRYVL
jgi:hypothetical protein